MTLDQIEKLILDFTQKIEQERGILHFLIKILLINI